MLHHYAIHVHSHLLGQAVVAGCMFPRIPWRKWEKLLTRGSHQWNFLPRCARIRKQNEPATVQDVSRLCFSAEPRHGSQRFLPWHAVCVSRLNPGLVANVSCHDMGRHGNKWACVTHLGENYVILCLTSLAHCSNQGRTWPAPSRSAHWTLASPWHVAFFF